jgi:hypothetical protein
MRRRKYASDIHREKFAEIELLLCGVHRRTKSTVHTTAQIAKRSELHKFAVIPKRWAAEV